MGGFSGRLSLHPNHVSVTYKAPLPTSRHQVKSPPQRKTAQRLFRGPQQETAKRLSCPPRGTAQRLPRRQAEPAPNPRIGCVQSTTSCLAGPSFYNIRAISATASFSLPLQGDKVPQPSPRFLCNSTIIHSLKQNFLPKRFFCAILDKHLGADGCWCALWSSKPVIAVSSCIGGFNSHTFPPDKKSKGPQTIFVCGPFIVLPFSYRTIRWRHIPVRPQCGQVSLRRVRVW